MSGQLFGEVNRTFRLGRKSCRDSELLSIEKFSVSHTTMEHSMTFCNSRMLPGQGKSRGIAAQNERTIEEPSQRGGFR
jgi:hypothetical protein